MRNFIQQIINKKRTTAISVPHIGGIFFLVDAVDILMTSSWMMIIATSLSSSTIPISFASSSSSMVTTV